MANYGALRPQGVSTKAWNAIIEAWENGLSDREAAFRAVKYSKVPIKESDIKAWMAENPDIQKLRDYLHSDLVAMARMNVAEEIRNGNTAVSKWYLERKKADEFSTKAAVAFEGAVAELSLEYKQKQLEELMKEFRNE